MLVPQALEGVASVGLLYAVVRRWFGARAGLVAGMVMALTPVAALMFRFNNPDALLMLLLAGAAYAWRGRWKTGGPMAGVLRGPAGLRVLGQDGAGVAGRAGLGGAYLLAGAPRAWLRRLWQMGAAGLGSLGAGWWVLIAQLTPAADRRLRRLD